MHRKEIEEREGRGGEGREGVNSDEFMSFESFIHWFIHSFIHPCLSFAQINKLISGTEEHFNVHCWPWCMVLIRRSTADNVFFPRLRLDCKEQRKTVEKLLRLGGKKRDRERGLGRLGYIRAFVTPQNEITVTKCNGNEKCCKFCHKT